MNNLKLDVDEGIFLRATCVERYGLKEQTLDEMLLTNKNIICVCEKGFFSKKEVTINKISLNSIKILNRRIQIEIIDHEDHGLGLQLLLSDGSREFFVFKDERKELKLWHDTTILAVRGEAVIERGVDISTPITIQHQDFSTYECAEKKSENHYFTEILRQTKQVFCDAFKTPITDANFTVSQEKKNQVSDSGDDSKGDNKRIFHCFSCGAEMPRNAKYCPICGTSKEIEQIKEPMFDKSVRHQEYAGTVLKCPNCGTVVTEMTAVCPDCGLPISKKETISSVQVFHNRLMILEQSRKGKVGGIGAAYRNVDPVDAEILTLIRNYPIPNSVDDIAEFMMLAISNIDVNLSRKTFLNQSTTQYETAATIAKTISNAWVAKMEQCYRKAEVAFPNHPTFRVIQQAYFQKINELNKKQSIFRDIFSY